MNFINGLDLNFVKAVLEKELSNTSNGNVYNDDWANHLEKLKDNIEKLNTLKKNTVFTKTFIDMYAFKEVLENQSGIDKVELIPLDKDGIEFMDIDPELIESEDIFKYTLKAYYSRSAYNGGGYHIGYENVVFEWISINKNELDLHGIPLALSDQVILPFKYNIISKELPDNELPNEDCHDSNCAIFKRDDDDNPLDFNDDPYPDDCDCGCNDNWDGYYQSDDDFFYSDMENIIYNMFNYSEIPEAIFNKEERKWYLGDAEYILP